MIGHNAIETVRVAEGVVTFDHSTCVMRAVWDNGYTETWGKRGYSYAAKLESFRNFVSE